MKAIKAVVTAGALILFVPLLLMLLFLMPIEFLVSSWHLTRVVETTSGVVSQSEVRVSRGFKERSDMAYTYTIEGRRYTATRLQAGFMSGRSFESGAGEFARTHPVGTAIVVHFDPRNPEFALLEYGWPKWSVGVSLLVWGLVAGAFFKNRPPVSKAGLVARALCQAMSWTGLITIAVFAPTLSPASLLKILAICGGVFLIAFGYAGFGFRNRSGRQIGSLAK